MASSRSLAQAKEWAPQAFAAAEGIRDRAEAAHAAGNGATAAALAEHSLAAFQHAVVLARLAQAEQRVASATQQQTVMQQQLDALQTSQKAVAERATALELEYKVARDAEGLEPIAAADPKREAARRLAARSIVEGARLLCLAARLLDEAAPVAPLQEQLDALDADLDASPRPTPINEAVRLRSSCLRQLTDVRRGQHQRDPAADPADVLLSRVSTTLPDSRPFRDDRGVVVAVPDPFSTTGGLTAAARRTLGQLIEIARSNAGFPILAVLHHRARDGKPTRTALEQWLVSKPLPRATVHDARDRLPASVHPVRASGANDSRVEFVFVSR
jgi:hypothetical protein